RPERIASDGAVPGDIPVHTHDRRSDRQRAQPDVPRRADPAGFGSGIRSRHDCVSYYPISIAVPTNRFESWEDVCALVAHFEIGDLPHAEWNHGAHLTVAFW